LSARLEELLRAAGGGENSARLARFGALVLDANRSFNLTGGKTEDEILAHLLDSLTVAPFVAGKLVDVGSGAGFPAIPVAIATGVAVTLVESARKKAAFLEHAIATLGIEGRVVAERAETAAREDGLRDAFDCGTARAVSTASTVAELLLPFVRPGGTAILQRGTMDDRERVALSDAALVLGGEVSEERALDGQRRIVIVCKKTLTPPRFPRRNGIPQKRPLCT
jgi:16S rRNA (guanine527-N7)-methyltransferase